MSKSEQNVSQGISRWVRILARADVPFYVLPLMMANIVAGTLAQHEWGLHVAQNMFFSTFITWIGPVPLPGGYTLSGALALALLCKFLFHSRWSWQGSGIILAHLGVLVLLLGGLASALSGRETFMILAAGETSPYTYDYSERRLYVYRNGHPQFESPVAALKDGQGIPGLPFRLTIDSACVNCRIDKRAPDSDKKNRHGMAQHMTLSPQPSAPEPEDNIAGVTLSVERSGKQDGAYIVLEAMPEPLTVTSKGNTYAIVVGRTQHALPFRIRLEEFRKRDHPGTTMAQAYESDITVIDNGAEWPVTIAMNTPLRYGGYTFYQSSFVQTETTTRSVLSVVENKGLAFPYIGSALVTLGLILHAGMILFRRKRA